MKLSETYSDGEPNLRRGLSGCFGLVALLFRVRKDRLWRLISAPPISVTNIGAADHILYDPPFAACFFEQGEEVVVESSLVLCLVIDRPAIIRLAAVWAPRPAADEGPIALDLKIIGNEKLSSASTAVRREPAIRQGSLFVRQSLSPACRTDWADIEIESGGEHYNVMSKSSA
jgi:hypothetical protein